MDTVAILGLPLCNRAWTRQLRPLRRMRGVMTGANAHLFMLMAENTPEGGFLRIHDLHLTQSHLPLFVVPWTLGAWD
jgi:hypothetical protein